MASTIRIYSYNVRGLNNVIKPTELADSTVNMASGAVSLPLSLENNSAPSTKKDLIQLKEELKVELLNSFTSRVTELIQPIQAQLSELVKDLRDTSKIAENTAELALTLQDDVKTLRTSETQINNRLTSLENRWRLLNLKFRGIGEGMEEGKELTNFLATWLAGILGMEEGKTPSIVKAYKLGPLTLARKGRPQDILAQFLFPYIRDRVLKEARIQGFLTCKDAKIQVLLDLSSETLDKR
ncbi:UNVERIFIED_CONTAM: hypothetical protein K2H54_004619 [Gekko kuhli]